MSGHPTTFNETDDTIPFGKHMDEYPDSLCQQIGSDTIGAHISADVNTLTNTTNCSL